MFFANIEFTKKQSVLFLIFASLFFPFYYAFSYVRYFEEIRVGVDVVVFSTNMYFLFLPVFFALYYLVDVFLRRFNVSLNIRGAGILFGFFAFVVVFLGEMAEREVLLTIQEKGYVECYSESEPGYRSTKLVFKKDISACGSDI